MKYRILAAVLGLLWPPLALAQSSPGLTYGQVPTAGQWNSYFASKQDTLGYTPVNRAGDTLSGPLRTFAPTGTSAGLILVPGLVPTNPADGSLWTTSAGLYARINGTTVGPLGSITPGAFAATPPLTVSVVSGVATFGIDTTYFAKTASNLSDLANAATARTNLGLGSIATLNSVSLASNVNGILPVANGGSGLASLPAGWLIYGNGTSAVGAVGLSDGQVLVGQPGVGAVPLNKTISGDGTLSNSGALTVTKTGGTTFGPFATASTIGLTTNVSGILPIANGGTGQNSLSGGAVLLGNGSSPLAGVALASGQLLVGQAGFPTAQTMGGDCTLSSAAAITCTKTAGTALGTAATKNVGTAASNVVQLDGSARLPAVDGSQLTNLPGVISVPVRQTVLSGPSTNGLPTFLPSTTGSLSITSQNISSGANAFVATAGNGFGTNGAINVVGISTSNLTWSALAASSTNYLGVTISGGTLTPFSTTLAPIYQYGGTASSTNGQYTFDIVGMQMYLGNGSTANAVNAVFVGEAATNASSVTSTITYAYQGYYDSGWTNTLPGTATLTSRNSNIGVDDVVASFAIKNLTAEGGYSIGDIVVPYENPASGTPTPVPVGNSRNAVWFTTGASVAIGVVHKTNGGGVAASSANWAFRLTARRRF